MPETPSQRPATVLRARGEVTEAEAVPEPSTAGSSLRPSRAQLDAGGGGSELARAFQANAEALQGLGNLQTQLIEALQRSDRSELVLASTQTLNETFRGLSLIQRELLRVLERHGLTRYSALGQRFDPTRHEVVARVVSDEQAPDTVVSEVAPGYALNGRVLRPAMVGVAAAPDEDAA